MPYVTGEKRDRLDDDLTGSQSAGELGYVLAVICDEYLARHGGPFRYQDLCDLIGTLECAKLELYRKIGSVYEDKMEEENGQVYHGARDVSGLFYG